MARYRKRYEKGQLVETGRLWWKKTGFARRVDIDLANKQTVVLVFVQIEDDKWEQQLWSIEKVRLSPHNCMRPSIGYGDGRQLGEQWNCPEVSCQRRFRLEHVEDRVNLGGAGEDVDIGEDYWAEVG